MRKVCWCNIWNSAAAYHSDVGSRVHLTEAEGLTGKTLCGKSFPADKGYPAHAQLCKRCVRIARNKGCQQGFSQNLDYVPSKETD